MWQALLCLLALASGGVRAADIVGSGASVPASVYARWASFFRVVDLDVKITYEDSSSSFGFSRVLSGHSNFGGSDIPLTPEQRFISNDKLISFPALTLAVGIAVGSALPENLVLPRAWLVDAVGGGAFEPNAYWDDERMQDANPGVELPHQRVHLLVRGCCSGTMANVKVALSRIAATEDRPWETDTGTSETWPVLPEHMTVVANGTTAMLDQLDVETYGLAFASVEAIEASGRHSVAMLNRQGEVVTTEMVDRATNLSHMDEYANLDTLDAAPDDPAWPLTIATYIIINQASEGVIDCQPIRKVVEFFSWALTNELAVEEANVLHASLPFLVRRASLQILQTNVTCQGELAAGGTGHIVLVGGSFSENAISQAANLYDSFEPLHPVVYDTQSSSVSRRLFLGKRAELAIIESPFTVGTVDEEGIYQVPLFAGPVIIGVNLPEIAEQEMHVALSLDALVGIYSGTVTHWSDPIILRDNWQLVSHMPDEPIVVITRSSGSGTTLAFTDALNRHDSTFQSSELPDWPDSFTTRATGNSDMARLVQSTRYAIGYMSEDAARGANVQQSLLVNAAGNKVDATEESIVAAAASFRTTDNLNRIAEGREPVSVSNDRGELSWPIMAMSYAAIRTVVPAGMSCATSAWSVSFLAWFLADPGAAAVISSLRFAPLPPEAALRVVRRLALIQCHDGSTLDMGRANYCPVVDGELCSGNGSCENTGDGLGIHCICEPDFAGIDCGTLVPVATSSELEIGLGVGGAAAVLGLIAAIFAWRRWTRVPVWMIQREDFTLDELVGHGGTALVFRGMWKSTRVAIKVMSASRSRKHRGLNLSAILLETDGIVKDPNRLREAQRVVDLNAARHRTGNTRTRETIGSTEGTKQSSGEESSKTEATFTSDGLSSPTGGVRRSGSRVSIAGAENYRVPSPTGTTTSYSITDELMLSGSSPTTKGRTTNATSRTSMFTMSQAINEVSVLAKLRHPNVAFLIAACLSNKHLFLIMELMEAGSLYEILRQESIDLYPSLRVRIGCETAHGLLFLHENTPPVLHMDLKSPNVLLDSHLTAKLTDFGLSSLRPGVQVRGTIAWTPPEVIRGQKYTMESDVYSLGLILWELQAVPAQSPWHGMAPSTIREVVLSGQRPPLDAATCPLGPRYAALIERCWAHDPAVRPSIAEIVADLDEMLTDAEDLDKARASDERRSLLNYQLPESMRDAILRGVEIKPVPYDEVSLIFTDIVGFTEFSSKRSAEEVRALLHELHDVAFDPLTTDHNAFHLETIGDAYICATGFPVDQQDHAAMAVRLAYAMTKAAEPLGLQIRAGVHSGPAVATVVGKLRPKLTLLGDTVNAASRMESISPPGKVTISGVTRDLLGAATADMAFAPGKIETVKGKGKMKTFVVKSIGLDEANNVPFVPAADDVVEPKASPATLYERRKTVSAASLPGQPSLAPLSPSGPTVSLSPTGGKTAVRVPSPSALPRVVPPPRRRVSGQ